jgi:Fe-S oxidoreductase
MLDTAKRLWRRVLDELRPHIRAGTPLIGMEPSCLAAFRDELPALFPSDVDAKRLSERSMMLSEFLSNEAADWPLPKLEGRKALVHAHCHHKAVMTLDGEEKLLAGLRLDYEMPDHGCCGLAGSFGFEAGEKYRLSQERGGQKLFPAVRDAADAIVIADGFSCRTHIEQATGRKPVHVAQVLREAMRAEGRGPGLPLR